MGGERPDETGVRELLEGGLLVSPIGDTRHQRLGMRLARELDRMLPDGLDVLHEANVRLRHGRILVPDVVVTTQLGDSLVIDAADVVLVAEVVSASSATMDRVAKPILYAGSGIPWYLRIERDPRLELLLFRTSAAPHALHARARPGDHLELPDLACTVDVDALSRRRG